MKVISEGEQQVPDTEEVNARSDGRAAFSEDSVERLRQRLGALHPEQVRAWQKMSPARRLEIACQAYEMAIQIVRVSEGHDHPNLPQPELDWRVTRRMQGNPKLGS